MALFSECSLQCARKVLDTARIVREAMYRQPLARSSITAKVSRYVTGLEFNRTEPTDDNIAVSPTTRRSAPYGITRNCLLLVNVPVEVVTVTKPVVAPLGTRAFR